MIKYMNGSVFSKARYMNGVGFEILARTPVPKLRLLPPHPPAERLLLLQITLLNIFFLIISKRKKSLSMCLGMSLTTNIGYFQ